MVGVLVAAAASALTHFLAVGWFVVMTCGVSDVADRFPADASPQWRVCASDAGSWWEVAGLWALAASAVLAVAGVVVLWRRRGGWRWVSPLPVLVLPVLTLVLLGLPSDACTDQTRRTHPAYDCRTTPDG